MSKNKTKSFKNLQAKLAHARSLDNPLPALPFSDIPELFNERAKSAQNYLTYLDEEDNRIELSYLEFSEIVLNTARFLKSKGLKKGDRIATASHNHWHTVVHYFASWLLGLVVVPINLGEDDERIEYILKAGNVKLIFVRDEYSDRIKDIINENASLNDIEAVICSESTDSFIQVEGELSIEEELGEEEALIVFTSGTTGQPKAVVLSQRNLLEDARAISDWHKIDSKIRMMCVLPIHHVNGTVVTMITPFFVRGSTVLNRRFKVEKFFQIVDEENVHIVSVVPTLLQYLNSYYEERNLPDYPTLKEIICGAGPLSVKVAKTFEDRFGIPILHGYGLSETTCYSCFLPIDLSDEEHKKWINDFGYPSIGVPIPANEMDIHDPDGISLSENERGEIVIRGVNVMMGYYNNREANEETFKHGWFRSGDEGFYVKDDEGRPFFFITGRLKELIIRGGVNLAPLEIDEVINKAPGVKSGIAVGFENDWYGEEVGAYIELEDGAEEDEDVILNFCKKHLPHSKTPKVIVFGDQIPVTSTGKYQRRKVTHLFKKWKEIQFSKNG
jgi:long-chain acyl-CoA synthetase